MLSVYYRPLPQDRVRGSANYSRFAAMDRRKLYKRKRRSGRIRGSKERISARFHTLQSQFDALQNDMVEVEREKREWEEKFRELEKYV